MVGLISMKVKKTYKLFTASIGNLKTLFFKINLKCIKLQYLNPYRVVKTPLQLRNCR